MHYLRSLCVTVVFTLAITLCTEGAHAATPAYKATDLTPPGFASSIAWCVAGGQQGGYAMLADSSTWYAMTWTGTAASAVNMAPGGIQCGIEGTTGTQQVGYVRGRNDQAEHATLWTNGGMVDLNPSFASRSRAMGLCGNQQVGFAEGGNGYHATLWQGTAASAVDLQPAGFDFESIAFATNGSQQVGYANGTATGYNDRAMLWSGTAASAINLNPKDYWYSQAYGIAGNQQVGYGYNNSTGYAHALLWRGTAESCVDLGSGYVQDTNGIQQVGQAGGRAALWSGTAASLVNLGQFLPAGLSGSTAWSIDDKGNIAGLAYDMQGHEHAILWEPVPEPASLGLLALGGLAILRRRRR